MNTVLLIDDDRSIRDALEEVLKNEGYCVFTVDNGKQALELLSKPDHPVFDLILLDLMMPVMTGQQFLEAIQGNSWVAQTPIAVFSANGRVADFQDSRVIEVIKKPIDLDGFLEIVDRCCA